MQAILLCGGDVGTREALDMAWPGWAEPSPLVIAVDGGLRHAATLGLEPGLWVGDGDSVDESSLASWVDRGMATRGAPVAKDESDTELAIGEAVARGADEVVLLGALGGRRVDHALANVALLSLPVLGRRPAWLLDPTSRISLVSAPDDAGRPVHRSLAGRVGDLVSLLPAGDGVEGVTTDGLAYPLRDEPLPAGPARGLSNVRTSPGASIVVGRGRLLIVESPATLDR